MPRKHPNTLLSITFNFQIVHSFSNVGYFYLVVTLDSVKEILHAVQASQRREKSVAVAVKDAAAALTGALRELTLATSEDVRR